MGSFYDTTVFVGYSFCDDGWLKKSEKALQIGSSKFTSDRVLNEYSNKHMHVWGVRRSGLLELRNKVADSVNVDPQSAVLSLPEIEAMVPVVPDDPRNTEWLKDIARRLAAKSFNKIELVSRIKRFMDLYFGFSTTRRDEIINWCSPTQMVIECYGRYQSYPDILKAFSDDGMINGNDNEIILDAHDLCAYCGEAIDLITGDRRDIKDHEAAIVAVTRIHSVVYLGDV